MKRKIFLIFGMIFLFNVLSISGYASCVTPVGELDIYNDTVFCQGTYSFNDTGSMGIFRVLNSSLTLDCNNSKIYASGDSFPKSAIFIDYSVTNVTIENCYVEGKDLGSGIIYWGINDDQYTENITIRNTTVNNTNQEGLRIFRTTNGVYKDIKSYNSERGFKVESSDNIILEDVLVLDSYGFGVYLQKTNNTTILNVSLENIGESCIVGYDNIRTLSIEDSQCNYSGLVSSGVGIWIDKYSDVTVDNFGAYNVNGDAGVSLHNGTNGAIRNSETKNVSDPVGGHGLAIRYTTNALIENNLVHDATGHGIHTFYTDDLLIYNNTVLSASVSGIRPAFGDNVTVDNNNWTSSFLPWWMNQNDNAVYSNNYVYGGIANAGGGTNVSIINNTFLGAFYDYIIFGGEFNHTFRGNKFDNATRVGFTWWCYTLSDCLGVNIDTSNTVDGKPMYAFYNRTSDITGFDTHFIQCINCQDVVISDMDLGSYAHFGTPFSDNMIVDNLTVSGMGFFYYGANATLRNVRLVNGTWGLASTYIEELNFSANPNSSHANITFQDSEITGNNRWGDLFDINVTLINTTIDDLSYFYGDSNSYVDRYWYLTFDVTGEYAFFDPYVVIKDSKNNVWFDGKTDYLELIALQYVANCPSPTCNNAGEVRDYYTNYSIDVTGSYFQNVLSGFDFTINEDFLISLVSEITPTGAVMVDTGLGLSGFISGFSMALLQLLIWLAVISFVLAIVYMIAYAIQKAKEKYR